MTGAVIARRPRSGSVSVVTPLNGSRAAVTARLAAGPRRWLPLPAAALGEGAWTVTLRAGPVSRLACCRVGEPVADHGGIWRSVQWDPAPEGGAAALLLPALRGELGLLTGEVLTLFLTGAYRPPGGALGEQLDVHGLSRVAEATARRFVNELARRLSDVDGHGPAS